MDYDLKKLTDAELLTRYTAGEEATFREIVDRYKNSLYAFLWKFFNPYDLVENVFQETFLQLFSRRESFDKNRPLRPWLSTIAANKAKDALRKGRRTSTVPIGLMTDTEDLSFDDMLNIITSYPTTPYEELKE